MRSDFDLIASESEIQYKLIWNVKMFFVLLCMIGERI